MGMIFWSAGAPPASISCVLCGAQVAPHRTVTGLCYAGGSQAFACRAHLNDGSLSQWVLGWQEFQATQVALDVELDGSLYVEQRTVQRQVDVTRTLTRHLVLRLSLGTALIVTENPRAFAPTLRKAWLELLREYKRQLSSTLNSTLRTGFIAAIQRLEYADFAAEQPARDPEAQIASVYLISPAVLNSLPRECSSIYILSPLSERRLWRAFRQLTGGGTVVSYVPLDDYFDRQPVDAELRTIS